MSPLQTAYPNIASNKFGWLTQTWIKKWPPVEPETPKLVHLEEGMQRLRMTAVLRGGLSLKT